MKGNPRREGGRHPRGRWGLGEGRGTEGGAGQTTAHRGGAGRVQSGTSPSGAGAPAGRAGRGRGGGAGGREDRTATGRAEGPSADVEARGRTGRRGRGGAAGRSETPQLYPDPKLFPEAARKAAGAPPRPAAPPTPALVGHAARRPPPPPPSPAQARALAAIPGRGPAAGRGGAAESHLLSRARRSRGGRDLSRAAFSCLMEPCAWGPREAARGRRTGGRRRRRRHWRAPALED